MVEAISSGVTIHYLRFSHTLTDHVFGYLFIIRAGFLFFFTFEAYGLMIVNG
jgi:hypothetical protein